MEEIKVHWFAEKLDLAGYSKRSIRSYCYNIKMFLRYLEEAERVTRIDEITPAHITAYHTHLQYEKRENGTFLSSQTTFSRLSSIKIFFSLLYEERKIPVDLASQVVMPRVKHKLPRNVPTVEEVCAFLDIIKPVDELTKRDRCIMEFAYATGLRAMELLSLCLEDIGLQEKTAFVHGKGGKDRIVPIGKWVVPWLVEYMSVVRPRLYDERKPTTTLFLSYTGAPLTENTLCRTIQKYSARMSKPIKLWMHGLRHACATHMLAAGADIRYIQELLGHQDLTSTQIYTRVDIKELKLVHRKYHPRERQ